MANEMSIGDLVARLKMDISGLKGAMKEAEADVKKGMDNVEKTVKSRGGAISALFTRFFGTAITVEGFRRLNVAIIDTATTIQRARLALLAVADSADQAEAELNFVRRTVKNLGTDMEVSIAQYARLTAASKSTSLQGQQTREAFEAISAASVVLGLSAQQTGRVFLALEQIISKGVLATEEIRRQMGDNLIGAFQIAARSVGVTTASLEKMLRQGQVISTEFVPQFTRELKAAFGSQIQNAAETLQVKINKLRTAWFEMKEAVGDAGFITAVTKLINLLTKAMEGFAVATERVFRTTKAATLNAELESTRRAIDAVDNSLQSVESRKKLKGGVLGFLAPTDEEEQQLLNRRKELIGKFIDLNDELIRIQSGSGIPSGLPDTTTTKGDEKAIKSLNDFRSKLRDQISDLEKNRAELKLTADTALRVAQAYDVLGKRADLLQDKPPVSAPSVENLKKAEATLKSFGLEFKVHPQIAERSAFAFTKLAQQANLLKDSRPVPPAVLEEVKNAESFIRTNFGKTLQLTAEQAKQVALAFGTIASAASTPLKPGQKVQNPVPPEIEQAAREAEKLLTSLGLSFDHLKEKNLGKLQDRIIELSGGLAGAKLDVDLVTKAIEALGEGPEPIEIPIILSGEEVVEVQRRLTEISQNARLGAIDTTQPGGARRRAISEIHLEFSKTAKEITTLGLSIGETQEEIAARVGEAWKKALQEMREIDVMTRLEQSLAQISAEAKVFGQSFDQLSPSISAIKDAIQELLREGFEPLSKEVQDLNTKLRNKQAQLEVKESFDNIIDSIAEGIEDTRRGIAEGTQTLSEGLQNLVRNVFLSLGESVFDEFVLEPLRKIVKAFVSGFVEEFVRAGDESIEKAANAFGKKLGRALREAIDNAFGSVKVAPQVTIPVPAVGVGAGAGAGIGGAIGGGFSESPIFEQDITGAPSIFENVLPAINESFSLIGDELELNLAELGEIGVQGFGETFATLAESLAEGISSLLDNLDFGGGSGGGGFWAGIIGLFSGGVGALRGGRIPHYSEGGAVPAILHEGEFVMRRAAVDMFGVSLLENMNRNLRLPQFKWGGAVPRGAFHVPQFQSGGSVSSMPTGLRDWQSNVMNGTEVHFNGDIIPRGKWATPGDVVKIVYKSMKDRTEVYAAVRDHGPQR